MAAETDAYRRLQEHLNKMPVGFPATKSGVEINLLKAIFTPEQANVATYLGYKHKSVDQIFESAKGKIGSKAELIRILDEIVSKGGIARRQRDGKKEYAVLPLLLWGMYEHQLKRLSPDFLMNVGQYLQNEFGYELATSSLPKMRVIPIEESVIAEHSVATYDELHREVFEIARQNEEEGLVLMPGNEQEAAFMCACCGDCCGMLSMMKNFPRPADVVASNYYAQVNTELCKGCGTCVTRCQMAAVNVEDKLSSVDLARCIGCGLCVPTCPEKAMNLSKKIQETVPPETVEKYYDTLMAGKKIRMQNP